jgi:peptide deformylase
MMGAKKIKFQDGQMYEYEIYDLVDPHSSILKQKLEPFDFANPPINPKYLAVSLIETMVKNRGVGLSANQVGLPYRVFVMGAEKVGFACFNPEIIETHGEDTFEEGCLSFPGLFIPVKRPATVKLRYTDYNGITKEETFAGFTARITLHEFDHLDGICYINKVSPIVLERSKRKVKSNLKKIQKEKRAFELEQKNLQRDKATSDPNTQKPTIFQYTTT